MLYTSSEDHEYFEQSFSHLSIYCDLIRRKLADGKIYKADPKIIVKWEKKLYNDIQALVEKKMKAYSQEQKAELIQVVFGLLRYNPKVRLTAEQSLFFLNKIAAEDISKRLTKEASS